LREYVTVAEPEGDEELPKITLKIKIIL